MNTLEPKIIEAEGENFIIHFQNDGSPDFNMAWSGRVYPIMYNEGFTYFSEQSSDSVEDIKDARLWFEWSFVWRGVWEGRVYFKQEEFWGEDIDVIQEIWNQIETIIKEQIRKDNPDYGHFD